MTSSGKTFNEVAKFGKKVDEVKYVRYAKMAVKKA